MRKWCPCCVEKFHFYNILCRSMWFYEILWRFMLKLDAWHMICGDCFIDENKHQKWMNQRIMCLNSIHFQRNVQDIFIHQRIYAYRHIWKGLSRMFALNSIIKLDRDQRRYVVNQGAEHVSMNTRRLNDFIFGILDFHRKVYKTSSFVATFDSQPIYQISSRIFWRSFVQKWYNESSHRNRDGFWISLNCAGLPFKLSIFNEESETKWIGNM